LQEGDRGPQVERDSVPVGFRQRQLPFLAQPRRRQVLDGDGCLVRERYSGTPRV
jgi:hypothetical protein